MAKTPPHGCVLFIPRARLIICQVAWISVLLGFHGSAQAQSCNLDIPASTPTAHFRDNADGTVTDLGTGLTWMRCAEGQNREATPCESSPAAMTWFEATVVAPRFSQSQPNRLWRLPTLQELSALAELSCLNPAANLGVFPQTQSANYWTATEFANDHNKAWTVHFTFGENNVLDKNAFAYVRWVSSSEHSALANPKSLSDK